MPKQCFHTYFILTEYGFSCQVHYTIIEHNTLKPSYTIIIIIIIIIIVTLHYNKVQVLQLDI